ncbi:MAG: FAD-dependent oxidoreductase [Candidatus Gygaella obscura]|nr:FAD-dependent oxidoreductase [Candidatus Gygaella obscura]
MNSFKAKLIKRIKQTPTIESFSFSVINKPAFLPGQFVQVMFDSVNSGNNELNKYLSISCSPTKDYLEVTKRLSNSKFSSQLKSLEENDEVFFQGPFGTCVFKQEFRKIGFLIGGIGITPVISILEYIVEKNLSTDSLLLYSNRSIEEIAFKGTLEGFSRRLNNIKTILTITEQIIKNNVLLMGKIDRSTIEKYIPDFQERVFFIFGPPAMAEAMSKILKELNVQNKNIKKEVFIGY